MVANDKRYADLPHEVRAYLESLDGEGITTLANLARFYNDLSRPREGKITPLDFLQNAKPRTLEWLKEARPEEIDQLDEAIRLVRSTRTVGRFTKWILIAFFGMFIVMSQAGEAVTKLFHLLKGGVR